MPAVLTEEERRGRRRRLVIILLVAALIVAGIFGVVTLRNHSLDDKADAATAELRSKWRTADLADLADAYNKSVVDANDSGNYDASIRLFPQTSDASFVTAQFVKPGVVDATYSVQGWGGSSECLFVEARGEAPPNRVLFSRGGSHC